MQFAKKHLIFAYYTEFVDKTVKLVSLFRASVLAYRVWLYSLLTVRHPRPACPFLPKLELRTWPVSRSSPSECLQRSTRLNCCSSHQCQGFAIVNGGLSPAMPIFRRYSRWLSKNCADQNTVRSLLNTVSTRYCGL